MNIREPKLAVFLSHRRKNIWHELVYRNNVSPASSPVLLTLIQLQERMAKSEGLSGRPRRRDAPEADRGVVGLAHELLGDQIAPSSDALCY